MIITKKSLSRRTLLRGMSATLALPLLDSMVPALTALSQTAARKVRRLGVVYVPNGIIEEYWTPSQEGAGFEFTPTLKPAEASREHLLVVSGLDNRAAMPVAGEQLGSHSRPSAAFLTGVHAKRTQGSALQLGISMDQIAAQTLGRETQLPSLELSLEGADTVNGVGTCDTGYSCAYLNISWRNETTPMPRDTNPRVVFERLFGDAATTDPSVRLARAQRRRSILDSVMDKVSALRRELGAADRAKISEYLEAIRDVERRIQVAEAQAGRELPVLESPAGIPVSFDEHARLMYDLLVLAYQVDLTRVFSFMIGREQSGTTYPQIGVPDPHHPITHHSGDRVKIEKVAKINQYHVKLFAEFLQKLKATPDGEGSLLDNSMILYGACLREANTHAHDNLTFALAGGGTGQLKSGRHVRCRQGTPMTDLQLTMLHKVGVNVDHFGDSEGELNEISSLG
jgi:hypothetical protein